MHVTGRIEEGCRLSSRDHRAESHNDNAKADANSHEHLINVIGKRGAGWPENDRPTAIPRKLSRTAVLSLIDTAKLLKLF